MADKKQKRNNNKTMMKITILNSENKEKKFAFYVVIKTLS